METVYHITTAAQLLATATGGCSEMIRGELVIMTPAGFEHGRIVSRVGSRLGSFVKQNSLGVVVGAGTGFQIEHDPDTVRAPDVGFVCGDRVPSETTTGFFQGAPDLAVEVLSPNDRAARLRLAAKIQDWLAAGCRAVWVIVPETKSVAVHRRQNRIVVLSRPDCLTGDDLLPEFQLPVGEFFASWPSV